MVAETYCPSGEACDTRAGPRTAETIPRKLCSERQEFAPGGSSVPSWRVTKRSVNRGVNYAKNTRLELGVGDCFQLFTVISNRWAVD
jgi:hypothetical protein